MAPCLMPTPLIGLLARLVTHCHSLTGSPLQVSHHLYCIWHNILPRLKGRAFCLEPTLLAATCLGQLAVATACLSHTSHSSCTSPYPLPRPSLKPLSFAHSHSMVFPYSISSKEVQEILPSYEQQRSGAIKCGLEETSIRRNVD